MLTTVPSPGGSPARTTPLATPRWAPLLAGTVMALGVLAAYRNSLSAPFLLDDSITIIGNPSIRQLWPVSSVLSPPEHLGSSGRPLLNLSFALNHAFGGTAVPGYHVLNLVIHALAGLTLFGLVRRTLSLPGWRDRFGPAALPLALVTAALWTLHPLQTVSVTYVSQRAESLMGLCYLLTLYCFVRGAESPTPGRWQVLAIVVSAMGMATKEVMVTVPVLTLLYDRTFLAGTFREAWQRRGRVHLGLAGTWLVLAGLMAGTGLHARGVGSGHGVTSWTYALTECRVLVDYLGLAVWPHPLVFDYGPELLVRSATQIVPHAFGLALLLTGTALALRHRPALGFLGCWFFVVLAPTSSLVPVALQPMAENRLYVPLAALITLGVTGAYALAGRKSLVVGLALAVGWGELTTRRNEDYRSELSIWTDTMARRPENSRAQNNLGNALFQLGRTAEALPCYEAALRLNPDYAEAHVNFGAALNQLGRAAEAMRHLEAALRLRPDHAMAHNNLANALNQLGRPTEAIPHGEAALRLDPDLALAHINLGNALQQLARPAEAMAHFEAALRRQPDNTEAHTNLANALYQTGRVREALAHYDAALRINPGFIDAHLNRASVFFLEGRVAEAINLYRETLRLKPDSPDAHCNLALALVQAGRPAEAITHFEAALRLKPDDATARASLARLRSAVPPGPKQTP